MDLLALAVPFFLLAILVELSIAKFTKRQLFRSSDAINSLSAGILSTTSGYFTKFIALIAYSYVLGHLALIDMPLSWFDTSPRGIAMWVIAVLAWDFFYYWNHRLGHEVSILWAAHAVHHQSEDYNLTTALRQTSSSFLFSWIFYVPLFVLGFPLEILLTVNAINLIYQFWVHTQLVDRLGILDRIVVTPSNHRVHHAQNARYIDKNYGGMLILWDRLFGTYAAERDDDPVVYGVRKPLASWNPFWANWQVYDYLLFDAINTKHWRDKLGLWFHRTGWRPADVAERFPKPATDITAFKKYAPAVSRSVRSYVMAQFALVVAFVLFIGDLYGRGGGFLVLVPILLLWVQLYVLGLLNEAGPYARRFELVRLTVVVPLGFVALQAGGQLANMAMQGWALLFFYVSLSVLWLIRK
jgi:sterol desaturase/sphingolipid hydroxylase (fatty acid hydroxylase superfamily)